MNDRWPRVAHVAGGVATVALLALFPRSASLAPWHVYGVREGSFVRLPASPASLSPPSPVPALPGLVDAPAHWDVTASALADVTGDQTREWVLLVWRPWRDWPIQQWVSVPSPVAGFRDAAGDSCHLILLDPVTGGEVWAGSALPVPLLALAVGDVDGDRRNEVVTLEGSYRNGRSGPATYVDVWHWNSFGFTLQWRSPPGVFGQLLLTEANNDGILDVAVR